MKKWEKKNQRLNEIIKNKEQDKMSMYNDDKMKENDRKQRGNKEIFKKKRQNKRRQEM